MDFINGINFTKDDFINASNKFKLGEIFRYDNSLFVNIGCLNNGISIRYNCYNISFYTYDLTNDDFKILSLYCYTAENPCYKDRVLEIILNKNKSYNDLDTSKNKIFERTNIISSRALLIKICFEFLKISNFIEYLDSRDFSKNTIIVIKKFIFKYVMDTYNENKHQRIRAVSIIKQTWLESFYNPYTKIGGKRLRDKFSNYLNK